MARRAAHQAQRASYATGQTARTMGATRELHGLRRDGTEFAAEIQRRADLERKELSGKLAEFVDAYTQPARQLSLRLA